MSAEIVKTMDDGSVLTVLKNEQLEAWIDSKGCTLTRLLVRRKDGSQTDVVLGHPQHEDYEKYRKYLGATVGRVTNRIGKGTFELNEKTYHLPITNGPNAHHGGINGFSFVVFDAEVNPEKDSVTFSRLSEDGEEGFPGNLQTKVTYSLDKNTLHIDFEAVSDQDTLVNMTNHSYFNLDGKADFVGDHLLQIEADEYVCVDSDGMATGVRKDTTEGLFGFKKAKKIKEALDFEDEQIRLANGLDHHFIFSTDHDQVRLTSEKTGLQLLVDTTLPGAQIYTANYMEGEPGTDGRPIEPRTAVCIECQKMPDDIHINKDHPETLLRKDDVYQERISWTFTEK